MRTSKWQVKTLDVIGPGAGAHLPLSVSALALNAATATRRPTAGTREGASTRRSARCSDAVRSLIRAMTQT
ncbi:MAG: hypothetical protein AAFU65_16830 [Pseudomonadota bacterium]